MAIDLVYKMASDLGIKKYKEETDLQFYCRTVYSGMACWIKAVSLDLPVSSTEPLAVGVSRRHIFLRCNQILNSLLKTKPELQDWFNVSENEDNAISLLRRRLLSHGDLLNAGFDTNVVMANKSIEQLSDKLQVVYGELIEPGVYYSGIATVRFDSNSILDRPDTLQSSGERLKSYLREAWWVSGNSPKEVIQYFNPFIKSKNNYSCWQDSMPKPVEGVVLARTDFNRLPLDYYLFKPEPGMIHKIDSFLIKRDEHIRVMMALRKIADNPVPAKVTIYHDHVHINLNTHLPLRELSLFESFAWPYKNVTDKLEWDISLAVWKYIQPYLEALEINMLEVHHG